MARHDALTNLPNRVLFRERVEVDVRSLQIGVAHLAFQTAALTLAQEGIRVLQAARK